MKGQRYSSIDDVKNTMARTCEKRGSFKKNKKCKDLDIFKARKRRLKILGRIIKKECLERFRVIENIGSRMD